MNKKFIIITITFFTMIVIALVILVGLSPVSEEREVDATEIRIIEDSLKYRKKKVPPNHLDGLDDGDGIFSSKKIDKGGEIREFSFYKDDIKPGSKIIEFDYKFQSQKIKNPNISVELDEKIRDCFDVRVDIKRRKVEIYLLKYPPERNAYDILFKSVVTPTAYIKLKMNTYNL